MLHTLDNKCVLKRSTKPNKILKTWRQRENLNEIRPQYQNSKASTKLELNKIMQPVKTLQK